MARPGVTYRQVSRVAIQLQEDNLYPSTERVRHILGTGSNSTINRHLNEWREKQGNVLECEKGLPESLLVAVQGIYESIKEDAASKVTIIQEESLKAQNDLNEQLTILRADQAQWLQEKKSLADRLQACQLECEAFKRHQSELLQRDEKRSGECALFKDRLQDKTSEIERLSKQLGHAQKNLDHYRESMCQERISERQYYEEKIAVLENKQQAKESMLQEEKQKNTVLIERIAAHKKERENIAKKYEEATNEAQQYKTENQKYTINYNALDARYGKIKQAYENLSGTVIADKKIMTQLQLGNENMKARLSILESSLEKTENAVRIFTDKNLFLAQEKAALETQLKQVLASNG